MTPPPDSALGETFGIPAARGLVMVGASGAACVDGVCAVDSVVESTNLEPTNESARSAS